MRTALICLAVGCAAMLGGCASFDSQDLESVRAAYAEMGETVASLKTTAENAQAIAAEALDEARASGDPKAVEAAQKAAELADKAAEKYAEGASQFEQLGAKFDEALALIQNGDFDQETGQKLGGFIGGLIGPEGAVGGSLLLGIAGSLWQRYSGRSRLKDLAKAINAAKIANPVLANAMDQSGPVIREAMGARTARVVDALRGAK